MEEKQKTAGELLRETLHADRLPHSGAKLI